MKTFSIPISPQSLIGQEHSQVDYQDAFSIKVPVEHAVPTYELVKLFFQCIPVWAMMLIRIRETIASWIGLKTMDGKQVAQQLEEFRGDVGQSVALFHVKESNDQEILTGETDKHLDFSLSFIGKKESEHFEITLATTVLFNGWLGRLYFLPVKPIHKILVPVMLKRMAKKLTFKVLNLEG